MSATVFSGLVREPTNIIELTWTDRIQVVLNVWIRVNGTIYHEDAGTFALDRTRGLIFFKIFKIGRRDEVLLGGTSVHILEALVQVAQDWARTDAQLMLSYS